MRPQPIATTLFVLPLAWWRPKARRRVTDNAENLPDLISERITL
ncbi:hypothetical protein HMPREF0299_6137 [Corynebacterium matruchotii ATCC 14266]|uniref:Uncharacterized protein n=1 Tax=Corynebacterium matruchotii ATCC 14266 TaxID=553207 RepID=E0DCT7_9CORY|nr:hypothetical protein HMPREF0299_6137 [Corynebacterium matruchotii ATCC 14266]